MILIISNRKQQVQTMNKSVKISENLYCLLVRYFYMGESTEDVKKQINVELNNKIQSQYKHYLYSKYKDKSLSDRERERARQMYLDEICMFPSFRY